MRMMGGKTFKMELVMYNVVEFFLKEKLCFVYIRKKEAV